MIPLILVYKVTLVAILYFYDEQIALLNVTALIVQLELALIFCLTIIQVNNA